MHVRKYRLPNPQFYGFNCSSSEYMFELICEPSAAKVTKIYSRRLPALEQKYRETKFSLLINLESQNIT